MRLNFDKLQRNIREASTEDLLNRITFYKAGMEPEAVLLIEVELRRRGVGDEEIASWAPKPEEPYIWLDDGTVARCSFCTRPAIRTGWNWHRLFGWLPLFPRIFRYCREHGSTEAAPEEWEGQPRNP